MPAGLVDFQFLTLKFVLINDGESNRKLPKKFTGKNVRMTKKVSCAELKVTSATER